MKTMKRALKLSAVLAAVLLATGCASSSSPTVGGGDVVYGDSKAVETVTNEFGSTDLQMISESMARSLMQHPSMAGRPLIVVAEVKNKTAEYIDTRNITNSMKTQLMKSGAKFVTDSSTMDAQVEELKKQNETGMYKNKAKLGQMKGAKYLLTGEITSIVKKNDSTKDVFYKFTLILKNIEEGVDEWQDEKEIRKTSKR
jgi:penicillin-binding protein activator